MQSERVPEEMENGHESSERADEFPLRPAVFRREDGNGEVSRSPSPNDGLADDGSGGSIATTLRNVAATLEVDASAPGESETLFFPKQPRTLTEVGLSKAFLTDLALKIIHYSGTPSTAQLMRRLGLGQAMVQQVLASLQEERLCEVLSQSDLYTGNYRYRLSERGTGRVMEALERTRYAGPAPVTADQYAEVIRTQKEQKQAPSRSRIMALLDDLVFTPEVADAVARALYSDKTTMLHGLSGNGKTEILERFAGDLDGTVLVPFAIYAYGQVIRVFDPSVHETVEELTEREVVKDDEKLDRRWVRVRRPAVVLGSEIGPESLDLAYDPQARFYQAPPHIKAQGGVLVVDDLGRQKMKTEELMTRWLIPAERGWDSLSLNTGEKLTVPFDVRILLGTNRPIHELMNDDVLRRILYKVEIPSPGPQEFAEILRNLCRQRNVQTPDGAVERVVERLYAQPDVKPRAANARDLVDIVIEGAAYDEREPVLDEDSFERALELFMGQRATDETA
ncbi:MAG: hypothetical protein V3S20_01150 [Dehalococcoidia bacterium]